MGIKDGYARTTSRYDELGKLKKQPTRTVGKPTPYKDGYARVVSKYDDRGREIEVAYFDEAGSPAVQRGLRKGASVYDDRGRLIEQAYLDGAGNPVRPRTAISRMTIAYDKDGRPCARPISGSTLPPRVIPPSPRYSTPAETWLRKATLTSRPPCPIKDGYAKLTSEYDGRGHVIRQSYFDGSGRPTRHLDGYAKFTAVYDNSGNRIEGAFFDETGKPVRHAERYARYTSKYVRSRQGDRGGVLRRIRQA